MQTTIEIQLDDPLQLRHAFDVLSEWAKSKYGDFPAKFRSDLKTTSGVICGKVSVLTVASGELKLTSEDEQLLRSMRIGGAA